ncbi:MAG: S8 family serine peptidase [Anaerolineae bacterium]|nr:S8 family serine peptidase [Anaerolineae bacterium]MDW8098281.1 S8 family serine peptidase [Anaerolineae bacterium]
MRRFLGTWLLLALLLVGSGAGNPGTTSATLAAVGEFAPGEVLVRWRAGLSRAEAQRVLAGEAAEFIETIAPLRVDRLRVPVGRELAIIARLNADSRVVYAEPNYLAQAAGVPNDPGYAQQWNLERVAAAEAWDVTTGDPDLIVAVIDSGADLNHPDLKDRLVYGWDYVRRDSSPDDEYGHGTHVAGIIGAITNNGIGVAGMSWQGKLLVYKVLDRYGMGTYADIASAIVSAQERGARVINLSLGGKEDSQTLLDAVNSAYQAGILLVAATGNDGNVSVRYPAAYPQVVAVGATTAQDQYAPYSNFGPQVDLAAPGGQAGAQVYNTLPSGYGFRYGTSMATAHVSGLAVLIWSIAPSLSRDQVRQILEDTADKVDASRYPYVGGRNHYLGYGRVHAARAVCQAASPRLSAAPTNLSELASFDQPVITRTISLTNPSKQPMSWTASVLAGSFWLSLEPPTSGSIAYPATARLTLNINASRLSLGTYQGLVRINGTSPCRNLQLDVIVQLQVVPQSRHTFLPLVLR